MKCLECNNNATYGFNGIQTYCITHRKRYMRSINNQSTIFKYGKIISTKQKRIVKPLIKNIKTENNNIIITTMDNNTIILKLLAKKIHTENIIFPTIDPRLDMDIDIPVLFPEIHEYLYSCA